VSAVAFGFNGWFGWQSGGTAGARSYIFTTHRYVQPGWPASTAQRASYWDMSQQPIRRYTAEQKPAATHIAAAHEFVREMQPVAEDRQQMIHIFPRGNASE
jgi:hypothetical protein